MLQHYRSTLDLNYTLQNRSSNLSKKKEEDQEARVEHNMRVLTDKLQKIKAVQYGEKLDDFSVKTILAYYCCYADSWTKRTLNTQLSCSS